MASDAKYQKKISRGLDGALGRAVGQGNVMRLDLDAARYVIFSDHHRGVRDKADDFRKCEKAYHAALGYYHELGYTLILLGDVEELWECRLGPVFRKNTASLALENRFFSKGRAYRFYGNHDDEWMSAKSVRKYLEPHIGAVSQVKEGLVLDVWSGGSQLGSMFLVHGHQGTTFSDRHRKIGRLVVRTFWRPFQRWTGKSSTTPAKDYELSDRHNIAMFNWASSQEKLVLVAGHTHKPVFLHGKMADQVEALLENLRRQPAPDPVAIAELSAELEWLRAWERIRFSDAGGGARPLGPHYFNTGCCSFGDGDVTGLEIVDGRIRLVRWPNDEDLPKAKVLAEARLPEDVFSLV